VSRPKFFGRVQRPQPVRKNIFVFQPIFAPARQHGFGAAHGGRMAAAGHGRSCPITPAHCGGGGGLAPYRKITKLMAYSMVSKYYKTA